MPLYSSSYGSTPSSGVQPAADKNSPPVDTEVDPVERPEFLTQAINRLAQVRVELSAIMAQDMCHDPCPGGYFKRPTLVEKLNDIESDLTRTEQRKKLETEEAALVAQINNILYVAALRVTPDVKPPRTEYDVAGEAPVAVKARK